MEERGGSELALFPTAVDAEGVMHSNTGFWRLSAILSRYQERCSENNFTDWMLLSNKITQRHPQPSKDLMLKMLLIKIS